MMTPQEVTSSKFQKAVFGGYDMTTVDDFLEKLAEDYSALYKENAILKGKLKVLVEKVEEYRSTEDAMRMALLTAQRMGDDLVAEAREKSEKMVNDAEALAKEKIGALRREIETEEKKLKLAEKTTADFVKNVKSVYSDQLGLFDRLGELAVPEEEPPAPPDPEPPADTVGETAAAISEKVSRKLAEKEPEEITVESFAREAESVGEAEPEPVDGAGQTKIWSAGGSSEKEKARLSFSNLKFGTNYTPNGD